MTQPIRIVTHSGGFHADDVFAVATLKLMLGDVPVEVVRTRDEDVIATGDYVVDVGMVHDPDTNRFDHHQKGGAGERENGVPYAAFGLVWKKYGEAVCGSSDVARRVEGRLVQAIDAYDNGFRLFEITIPTATPFLIQDVLGTFEPLIGESKTKNEAFLEAVDFAQHLLVRSIDIARNEERIVIAVKEALAQAEDKRLFVLDDDFIADRVAISLAGGANPDARYFVRHHEDGTWQLCTVSEPPLYDSNRVLLPESWAGKRDAELAEVTGVTDAVFCHNARFMAVAKTKEGAIALAKIVLEDNG